MNRFRAFLAVSRANLLVASLGHATLGMFLAVTSLTDLFRAEALLFVMLHYSIAFLACNINSLSDLEVDSRYKKYISDGVRALGRRNMWAIIATFLLASMALTAYFALSGFMATALLASLGILSALAYSFRPLRLKGTGPLSPVPILFGLYMLPLFGGWFIFRSDLDPLFAVFVIGYALMNEGFTLVNTCEDYSEDRAEGLRTWAHVFGLRNTLKVAHAMAIMGLLCPVAILLMKFHGGGTWAAAGMIALALTTAAILRAASEVGQAGRGTDLETSAKRYGKMLPKWFLGTRYPLMLTALIMLL